MRADHKDTGDVRRLRVEVLRQAARIAESEASLLAADYWNHACQRIAQRLAAQAAREEFEVVEPPAAPAPTLYNHRPCRSATPHGRDRRSF